MAAIHCNWSSTKTDRLLYLNVVFSTQLFILSTRTRYMCLLHCYNYNSSKRVKLSLAQFFRVYLTNHKITLTHFEIFFYVFCIEKFDNCVFIFIQSSPQIEAYYELSLCRNNLGSVPLHIYKGSWMQNIHFG